jgi:hypothetical protein
MLSLFQSFLHQIKLTTMLLYFFRFSKWIIPLYIIFLFACSVGFQTCLRFNSHLNSWTLTFWRSILQLIIGLLGLCFTSQSFIGPPGSRFKLFCHVRIKFMQSLIYVVIGFCQSRVGIGVFFSTLLDFLTGKCELNRKF